MSVKPKTVGPYRRLDKIGYGNFGVVYRGVDTRTRRVVAIKTLDLDTVEDEVESVQHEVGLLAHLSATRSSNVTRYFGTVLDGSRLWLVMDLCSGGSVRTLLQAGSLDDRTLGVLFREIAIGVRAIHNEGIIHRDLKAANVLITMSGQVRLCDFGVAAPTNRTKRNTVVGTPYWMAPEVITEGQSYTNKADIWSLGITFYELVTGNPPYAEHEAMRALLLITSSRPPRLEGPKYAPALKDLVALCLDEDPRARPSADDVLKHKFIKMYAKVPTTILRSVVERYMAWKRDRQDHRDSLLMFNSHPQEEDEEDESDTDSVWDFGDEGAGAAPAPGAAAAAAASSKAEDMHDAPNSLREIFGVPPRSPDNPFELPDFPDVPQMPPAPQPQPQQQPRAPEASQQQAPQQQAPQQQASQRQVFQPSQNSTGPGLAPAGAPHLSRQKSDAGPRVSQDPPQLGALELGPSLRRSASMHPGPMPPQPTAVPQPEAGGPQHFRPPRDRQPSAISFARSRSTTISATPTFAVDGWKGWRRHGSEAQTDQAKRAAASTTPGPTPVPTPSATPAVTPGPAGPAATMPSGDEPEPMSPRSLSRHNSAPRAALPPRSPSESPLSSPTGTVAGKATRPRRAPLPQLQMPPRPKNQPVLSASSLARAKRPAMWTSEFPPMPQIDTNALLDSAPDELVTATLLELVTGYKTAVSSLAGQFE